MPWSSRRCSFFFFHSTEKLNEDPWGVISSVEWNLFSGLAGHLHWNPLLASWNLRTVVFNP